MLTECPEYASDIYGKMTPRLWPVSDTVEAGFVGRPDDDANGTRILKVATVNSTDEDLGMTPETGPVYLSGTFAHVHCEGSCDGDSTNSTTV